MRVMTVCFAIIAGVAAISFQSKPAQATQCQAIAPYVQHCVSGISSLGFNAAADTQHTPVWCWAASAEMIFTYNHHRVRQEDIVSKIFGAAIPSTASDSNIDEMLTSTYTDTGGNDFTVSYNEINRFTGLYDIVGALDNDEPLLITTSHHAMVLTGIEFNRNIANGLGQTTLAVVRDPWPVQMVWQGFSFAPGRRAMSLQEFLDIRHIYRLSFQ